MNQLVTKHVIILALVCNTSKDQGTQTRWDLESSQLCWPTLDILAAPQLWLRAQLYYCCLDWMSISFSGIAQGMALSAGSNTTGPILEYSTYHYIATLQQLIICT